MKIGKDKVVTMTYTLRANDEQGDVIQKVEEGRPFVQLFGAGTLLPTFEKNLDGLEKGDSFGFQLMADEAYGAPTDDAIIELEKNIFMVDGKFDTELVAEGKMLTMQDQHGNPIDGKVMAIKENSVIMDFNHPLAGENLYFSGKILDVREASSEEISHGHIHSPEGHHH